jgi:hypothetical protein
LEKRAKDVLQAYSVIDGEIRPEGSLKDLQQHWQAIKAVGAAVKQCKDNNDVLQELLRTQFLQKFIASAAGALQRAAAAGSSVGPEEPALATAANLTKVAAMLFSHLEVVDCRPELVVAVQHSGEDVRPTGGWSCVVQDRAFSEDHSLMGMRITMHALYCLRCCTRFLHARAARNITATCM